jgi:hypothetical protein
MRLKCSRFQRYYRDLDTDFYDTNDERLKEALSEYQRQEAAPFTYLEPWALEKSR